MFTLSVLDRRAIKSPTLEVSKLQLKTFTITVIQHNCPISVEYWILFNASYRSCFQYIYTHTNIHIDTICCYGWQFTYSTQVLSGTQKNTQEVSAQGDEETEWKTKTCLRRGQMLLYIYCIPLVSTLCCSKS